ncbi:AAA family ATPase [Methanobacterium sp. MZD130B]|uniref:AAA family ATPase n=1 Tax=Methanobacterium sp. MZD130B TaxID=3394378 RepID=UPI0039FBBF9B
MCWKVSLQVVFKMRPWERVAVVGVPGAGKTSLCTAASENSKYQHVNYGRVMLEIAQNRGLATTLPEMFSLDLTIQHGIWEKTALQIKDKKNILLDLHGLDHFREGYLISLPLNITRPDIIIIIESAYEDIIHRIRADPMKKRIIPGQKTHNEHVKMLRLAMISASACLGCNLIILNNYDFETCLTELESILVNKSDY